MTNNDDEFTGKRDSRKLRTATWLMLPVVCLVVVGWQLSRPLPPPEDCTWDQLLHWMACYDLREKPSEFRVSMVDRFQVLLPGQPRLSLDPTLDENYRQTISQNATALIATWLKEQTEQFTTSPAASRNEQLDEMLELIELLRPVLAEVHLGGQHAPASFQVSELSDGPIDANLVALIRALGMRWLETADLQQAIATKSAIDGGMLCDVLTQLSRFEPDVVPAVDQNQESASPRAEANIEVLARLWLIETARRFSKVEDVDTQRRFLTQRMAELDRVYELSPGSVSTNPIKFWQWIEDTPTTADEKNQIRRFAFRLQEQWLRQSLRKLRDESLKSSANLGHVVLAICT